MSRPAAVFLWVLAWAAAEHRRRRRVGRRQGPRPRREPVTGGTGRGRAARLGRDAAVVSWRGDDESPAEGTAAAVSVPSAGSSGAEFRARWRAERVARGRASRGGQHRRRAARGTLPDRAGMIRRPPPEPGGNGAA